MTAPNIVIICTDDEKWAEVYDGMLRSTFKTLMRDAGTSFPRYQVVRSVCSPSRATYLTGQYSHNHGNISVGNWGTIDKTNLLFRWLWGSAADRKVQTGFIGKINNDYDSAASNAVAWPTPTGIDHWRAFNHNGGGSAHAQVREENYNADGTLHDGAYYPPGALMTEWVTDYARAAAVDLIQRFTTRDVSDARYGLPFYLHICPTTPHVGTGTAPVLPGDQFGRTARLAAYNTWTPPFLTPGTAPPNIDMSDTADVNASLAQERSRMQGLIGVDDLLSAVIAALTTAGVLADTIIVYTSDNGWANGENGDWQGKDTVYDAVMKVPFVMRGPGIPVGAVNNARITNLDWASTACAWMGVPTGSHRGVPVDGYDFRPAIADETVFDDRALLITSGPMSKNALGAGDRGHVGILTARYKFAMYYKQTPPTGEPAELLFDLLSDPYEITNQAANPAYADIKAQLMNALLGQLRACSGSSCRVDFEAGVVNPGNTPNRAYTIDAHGAYIEAPVKVYDGGAIVTAPPTDDPEDPDEPKLYVDR